MTPFLRSFAGLPQLLALLIFCLFGRPVNAQPTVTGLTPSRNAVVARTAAVSVDFSQSVDARSSRALRVFSSQAGGKKVGTASVTGTQLSFTPSTNFKAGETVWATLDTSARG
jgi:NhaP-type Na+/H+ or K+/H+ antiporter